MADAKKGDNRRYSTFGRPFRLQLRAAAASGFASPASRGRCQYEGCHGFEWCTGAKYCKQHWLTVYHQTHLPERWSPSS